VPFIYYTAQISANATNNALVHTSATIEHALDPSPLYAIPPWSSQEDRYAFADLVASVPEGLLIAKTTNTPYIESNGAHSWTLQYRNTSANRFDTLRIVDVLPFNGDAVNTRSVFSGVFSGGSVSPLLPGEYDIYYSTSPSAQINRNPNCVSNGGSIADGGGVCPSGGATWSVSTTGALPNGVTAIRIDDRDGLAANASQTISLQLSTFGARPGDVYENSFTAVASGQTLVVASAKARIRIPAAELRGMVYLDLDGSDTLNVGDTGIAATTLVLTGTDNLGNTYRVTTASVAIGTQIVVNDVQINGGLVSQNVCDAGSPLRGGQYLFCDLPTSNDQGYTITQTQPNGYLDGAETLGILSSNAPRGLITANDVIASIRVTNNLLAGQGDFGAGYNFGERMGQTDTTSTVSCSPQRPAPGSRVNCVVVCTNHGPLPAQDMTCKFVNTASLPNAAILSCDPRAEVAVGGTRRCTLEFDFPQQSLPIVSAGSGASNDSNGGSIATAGNNPSEFVFAQGVIDVPIGFKAHWLLAFMLLWVAGVATTKRAYRKPS
jgi:hypothetical protein